MKQAPLFSIIIPTFNRSGLLQRAIQSVLDQEVSNWELLVIDDGSTDDTKQKLTHFQDPRIHYYYQKNQGQSAARNQGVRKAKGAYVLFLDDDDYYLAHHLRIFQEAIQAQSKQKPIIYRTGFTKVKADKPPIKTPNFDPQLHPHPVQFAAYHMCGLWTLCLPKICLKKQHSPTGFPHWQDTHLILRLLASYDFQQLDDYSYTYIIHEKMGSQKRTAADTLYQRALINVAAMDDLFEKHGALVLPFLPADTLDFLKAEKFIEYANSELVIGGRRWHWQLLKRSLSSRFDLRLWKHYLLFIRHLLWPPL